MSIQSWYLVPKMTSIAGIGTGTSAGTQLLVVPVPNTKKKKYILSFWYRYYQNTEQVEIPVSGKSTGNRYAYQQRV